MSLCMHVHRLSSCCSLALVVDRLQGLSEIFEVHVIEIIVVHLVAVTILHDNIQSLLYILRKKQFTTSTLLVTATPLAVHVGYVKPQVTSYGSGRCLDAPLTEGIIWILALSVAWRLYGPG